jgi:hypothetical protein
MQPIHAVADRELADRDHFKVGHHDAMGSGAHSRSPSAAARRIAVIIAKLARSCYVKPQKRKPPVEAASKFSFYRQ